jgi:flagellar biogenesis protein FliO
VLALPSAVLAQVEPGPLRLAQDADLIQGPSLVRVVLVLLFAIAIAVAVIAVLRKFMLRLPSGTGSVEQIRIISRATPAAGLRLHVIDVLGQRVLITESRAGLATVVLGSSVSGPSA